MADDRYDDDYWAMAEFQFQNLRADLFGLPRVPGGRPLRTVEGGPASQNVEDRRVIGEPTDLRFDANRQEAETRIINSVFSNMLRRVEPHPFGNPESFQAQDPLR